MDYYCSDVKFEQYGSVVSKKLDSSEKDPSDPRTVVSLADLESEKSIISTLRNKLHCNFLSEEAGELIENENAEYRVVIDSLDGSKNYINGAMGLFGVSIGLEKDNQLVAGAIYLPYFGELLLAQKNEGAFIRWHANSQASRLARLNTPQIGQEKVALNNARICIGRGAAEASVLSRPPLSSLMGSCNEAVNYASCTVGLASVALGRIDALVLPGQKYWDFAGGYPIFHEIGAFFGVWRDSWCYRVDEKTLTMASSSDYFDIVAARDRSLFNQIVDMLNNETS